LESLGRVESIVIFIRDTLDDFFNKGVLLLGKVLHLDFLEKLMTSSLSDHQSFCDSATLHGDFGSILEVTEHQVTLDHDFWAFVPIGILGDSLGDRDCARRSHLIEIS